MGNLNSSRDWDDDMLEHDSSDEDILEQLGPDNEDGYYVAMFLRRMIDSGEFSREPESYYGMKKIPKIKIKPDLAKLKNSNIFQSVKTASGLKPNDNVPNSNWSIVKMIGNRQRGTGSTNLGFSTQERCKINNKYIPNHCATICNYQSKVYCGCYSKNGKYFITASQDHVLRVLDSSNPGYRRVNRIQAKDVGWCIIDVAFSPDDQYFVYSTWSKCLHISPVTGNSNEDLQCLYLQVDQPRFCVFSLSFSACGKEIINGTSDGCIYIYDRYLNRRTLKIPVRNFLRNEVDVNAVGFLDDSSNVMFSGMDDGIVKLWDRRCLNETHPEPIGILVGHLDGITYIDSKNDGRYLISNSKDQSIKLWDVRTFSKSGAEERHSRMKQATLRNFNDWDYRWDEVPKDFYNTEFVLEDDVSVMTYRGHVVNKSLIRAKFSPLESTGQRYIYTGDGTGRLILYDVLTGAIVSSINSHDDVIRDVDWHPNRNEIATSSFDGRVNLSSYKEKVVRIVRSKRDQNQPQPPRRRSKRIAQQRANEQI